IELDARLDSLSSREVKELRKENQQLADRLSTVELIQRRTELSVFAAQEQIDQYRQAGVSPFPQPQRRPLVIEQAVEARIIGDEIVSLWKSYRLLDRGSGSGLFEDQLVLDEKSPRIDHGQKSDVVDGLAVFAGRCIVGRVARAGRWTSSLQLISDPQFRAKAIVLRQNSGAFSREVLIEGVGNGNCRLVSVPSTELIEVDSLVYAVPGDRGIEVPMLFGRVTSANLAPGSLHWQITVTPEIDVAALRHVEIVTTTLNPDRMSGDQGRNVSQAVEQTGETQSR
ncbi:MAG: rod shape-determining protein MreC, partial [Planctomycetaceae bacterium]